MISTHTGWYEDNWFEVNLKEEGVNCTREQMAEAAEGHITTEALMWDHDNSTTISGMVGHVDPAHFVSLDFGVFISTCILWKKNKVICYIVLANLIHFNAFK